MPLRDLFPSHGRAPVSASSLRAPFRGEIFPITVTGTSTRYAVPAPWRGSLVRIQADGGDVYVQVSLAADAAVDSGARATTTGTGTLTLVAPTGTNTGGFKIPDGTWLDVPFPDVDGATFALVGAGVARCHLAET